jgi:hypothetical protein
LSDPPQPASASDAETSHKLDAELSVGVGVGVFGFELRDYYGWKNSLDYIE